MSETIKFETNIPQVIALAFTEGKEVESQYTGTQVMFSTVDGRRMYLAPFVAEKIKAAGIVARMPFEICRKQAGKLVEWQVRTHNAAVGGVSEALPTTARVQSENGTTQSYTAPLHHRDRGNVTSMNAALDATYNAMAAPKREMSAMATRILAAYVVAFEVAAALEQVVDERGLALNFTKEDFICRTAATAFIEANKAAR